MTFGFIGPTYRTRSLSVDSERCVNRYPEVVESGAGKSKMVLQLTPGLLQFCELDDFPIRAEFEQNGRAFAVAGGHFYEVFSDGTWAKRGVISRSPTNAQAYISSNGVQLMISSREGGWVYDLQSNVLQPIQGEFAGSTVCGFMDGYFIALKPNSRTFTISGLYDGVTWDGLDFASKEGNADNLVSLVVDHRRLWLLGGKTSEADWDSGNPDFPFERIDGAFMEQGAAAAAAAGKADNTIVWLGANENGKGIAWRANGYTPVRISNHSIEWAWSQYPRISDAILYVYQDQGHTFAVFYFPSGNQQPDGSFLGATWVYDFATGMWHEREWLDPQTGVAHAHRGRAHMFAFGKHLIGDRETGQIYDQSINYYDDNGNPKRWLRSAPHISQDGDMTYYSRLQLDMQMGDGVPQSGQGSAPTVVMQISNDGGYMWGNEVSITAGRVGQYKARAIWRRLGRSRDRCFRIFGTDPVPSALIEAYLSLNPGIPQ